MVDWSKLIGRLTRIESLWTLGGMIVSSGAFAWVWQNIEAIGWPLAILLGFGSVAGLMFVAAIFLIAWRYCFPFKEAPLLNEGSITDGAFLKLTYRQGDALPEEIVNRNVFSWYSLVNRLQINEKMAAITNIVIVFDRPINSGRIRVRFNIANPPEYEIKDRSPRHALIAVAGAPQNYIIEIETY